MLGLSRHNYTDTHMRNFLTWHRMQVPSVGIMHRQEVMPACAPVLLLERMLSRCMNRAGESFLGVQQRPTRAPPIQGLGSPPVPHPLTFSNPRGPDSYAKRWSEVHGTGWKVVVKRQRGFWPGSPPRPRLPSLFLET